MVQRIILLLFLFSLTACIKEIDFNVEKIGGELAVDGMFTNDTITQIIRLGRAALEDRIPIPIRNAQIHLINGAGEIAEYIESSEEEGVYSLPFGTMKAEIGQSYYVQITLPDGKVYESTPEVMQAQPGSLRRGYYEIGRQDVLNGTIVSSVPIINVFADIDLSQAPEVPYFVRWDVEEVYKLSPTDFPDPFGNIPPPCYVFVSTSAEDLNLYDGRENEPALLERVPLGTQEIDNTFLEKHVFSIYQRSLTKEAFEYAEKVDQILTNVGNIFDTPPAPIPGNIRNINDAEETVLGYFSVASSQVQRFATFRFDIPFELVDECGYVPWKRFAEDYPRRCINCLTIRNSTYIRPGYF